MTNPKRDSGSERYGFLLLHVQLILDGHTIHIEPLPGREALALNLSSIRIASRL